MVDPMQIFYAFSPKIRKLKNNLFLTSFLDFQILYGVILEGEEFSFDVGIKDEHVDKGVVKNSIEV